MKFDDLLYDGKFIKVVVDIDEVFIEQNEDDIFIEDDNDTLDLTNIAMTLYNDKGD